MIPARQLILRERLVLTSNPENLSDKSEAASGPVTFSNPLEQALDFLGRIQHGVLADIQIPRL